MPWQSKAQKEASMMWMHVFLAQDQVTVLMKDEKSAFVRVWSWGLVGFGVVLVPGLGWCVCRPCPAPRDLKP